MISTMIIFRNDTLKNMLLLLFIFVFPYQGYSEAFIKRNDLNRIEPATAIAISQAALQIWQAMGTKDRTLQQLVNMVSIIDQKLDLINDKMDLVILELNNVDQNTYRFFMTSEGEVLLKNMITFDRSLYTELQGIPSFQRDSIKRAYIIGQQATLNSYSQRLHDVFLALEKFGNRPEIASYISVSFQMENRIYQHLLEAKSSVLPKSLMKARQQNYLKYFAGLLPKMNDIQNNLNKNRPNKDREQISSVLNSRYLGSNKWVRNAVGIEFIRTRKEQQGRGGRRFDHHVIRRNTFTLVGTGKLHSENLDILKNDYSYDVADWFYGFGLNVNKSSREEKNYTRKKPGSWKPNGHNFIPAIKNEINSKLPQVFESGRNYLIAICYAIENISQSLFTIQRNEINQIYI